MFRFYLRQQNRNMLHCKTYSYALENVHSVYYRSVNVKFKYQKNENDFKEVV
jgi:hypothetical protein